MPTRRTAGRATRSPDEGGHQGSSRPTSGHQGQSEALGGAHFEEDTRVALGEPVRLTHVDQLRQLWKLAQPDGLTKLILAFGARAEGGFPRKVAPWLLEGEGIASERHSCTIRGHQRQSEAIRDHQGRFVALRGTQRPSETIRGNQRPSETIRDHQGQSEAIRGHQRPTGAICGTQRHSEAIGGRFQRHLGGME